MSERIDLTKPRENKNVPIIELKDAKVVFTTRAGSGLFHRNRITAVTGVNLKLMPGKTIGIVGESGCGKSTTANVMCGLQSLTSGQVLFKGQDVTHRTAKERMEIGRVVSVVFQDPATALNARMSVADQLIDPLAVHHLGGKKERDKRAHELIRMVGLPFSVLGALPGQLSGGQRQRVAIARAFAQPGCDHRRRADERSRRLGARADPEPVERPQTSARLVDGLHQSRHPDDSLHLR